MGLAELPPDSPHRAMWSATTRELLGLVDEAAQPGALGVLPGSILGRRTGEELARRLSA